MQKKNPKDTNKWNLRSFYQCGRGYLDYLQLNINILFGYQPEYEAPRAGSLLH